jgi:hypothetical protein
MLGIDEAADPIEVPVTSNEGGLGVVADEADNQLHVQEIDVDHSLLAVMNLAVWSYDRSI